MELTFDDEKMQFYPPKEDLEETVVFVIKQICKTMQQVPTVQSWLAGGSTVNHTDVSVADHVVHRALTKLKKAVKLNFEDPQYHLESFSKFSWRDKGEIDNLSKNNLNMSLLWRQILQPNRKRF